MDLLKQLQIKATNAGACSGDGTWSSEKGDQWTSYNPANGETIASVIAATENDYENILQASQKAFLTWRMVPAPKRGEVVRKIGERLRQYKDALGTLVFSRNG